MAELEDALGSGPNERNLVEVRILSPAQSLRSNSKIKSQNAKLKFRIQKF